MMRFVIFGAVLLFSAPALAQTTPTTMTVRDGTGVSRALRYEQSGSGSLAAHSVPEVNGSAVSAANPLPTADAANAAFSGVVAITPGVAVAAARSLGFVITTGGTVTLTLSDASTITLTLAASPQLQTLPFAVTNVALGTAAGTFWNLK